MTKLPLLVPKMPTTDALIPYLRQIDTNRIYTNFGPLNSALEDRFSSLLGIQRDEITSISNCTVGLELVLQTLNLPPKSAVLLPSLTFVATATAVVRAGLTPIFADVDEETWSLTPQIAESAISSGRKFGAIMPVATFGREQSPEEWDAFQSSTGIHVVIDAAGAFGNQRPGNLVDVVFSLHATKSIGAGEGGLVISRDVERINEVRRLSNFGIDTSVGELTGHGTNGKLSEYHAAVGLAALDEWPAISSERQWLHKTYLSILSKICPSVVFQKKDGDGIYPILPVLLPEGAVGADVSRQLSEVGVQSRRWYCPPLHLQGIFSNAGGESRLAVSEKIGERLIGIPYFLGMTESEMSHVANALNDVIAPSGI